MAAQPAPSKDRITCHVLDTTQGLPARNLRVRLELLYPSPSPASGAFPSDTPTSGSSSSALGLPHHRPARTFESQTDDDGRVRSWLPYSPANASGEVPIYTLDDVMGTAEEGGSRGGAGGREFESGDGDGDGDGDDGDAQAQQKPKSSTCWTLRFDSEGYFGGPDKTFFPEVAVTFRVEAGQHYHVPLLLNPYSYTTYRGS